MDILSIIYVLVIIKVILFVYYLAQLKINHKFIHSIKEHYNQNTNIFLLHGARGHCCSLFPTKIILNM